MFPQRSLTLLVLGDLKSFADTPQSPSHMDRVINRERARARAVLGTINAKRGATSPGRGPVGERGRVCVCVCVCVREREREREFIDNQ